MALFDKEAFDNLIDGDRALFVELIQLYATDYRKILIDLNIAIEQSDMQQVEILAHRLRGMVRNFFAARMADQAEEIEEGGRGGNLEGASVKLSKLAVVLKQLEDELKNHLGSFK